MKHFPNWLLTLCFLLFFLLILPSVTFAGGPGEGGCDPGDPTCPIDGGLTVLLAIGAGYGIKKVKELQKEKS